MQAYKNPQEVGRTPSENSLRTDIGIKVYNCFNCCYLSFEKLTYDWSEGHRKERGEWRLR